MEPSASAAREVEELLQFLYLMPVAVVRFGRAGDVEMLNPKAVQLLQDLDIDAGETDGTKILEQLFPGLAQIWRASENCIGSVVPGVRCTPPRPGRSALHLMVQLVRPDQRCTMLVIEDVTTTVEQEREITRQRRRMGLVLEHIQGYCAVMLEVAGRVVEWNPSIGRLLGVQKDDIVGQPLLSRLADDVQQLAPTPAFVDIANAVKQNGWCRLQAPWRKLNGEVLWGDCVVAPVVESDGTTSGYVAVIRDVTDEHWRTQKLIDAALTDPLTSLYNRRGLERRAEALLIRPHGAPAHQTWVMIDIDHFKVVNDTFGHEGGDIVLKAVAAALQAMARDCDILARLGGEEFVVLLPDAALAAAAAVAERMRLRVESLEVQVAGQLVRVSASFGIAQQISGEANSAVLERADAALYRAKSEGRNRVIVADQDS